MAAMLKFSYIWSWTDLEVLANEVNGEIPPYLSGNSTVQSSNYLYQILPPKLKTRNEKWPKYSKIT